jgi:hypothetical protein
MEIFIAALAVYKAVQVLDSLSPREAMPWVKILLGVGLSYPAGVLLGIDDIAISGLAIATLSGTIHSVLRFLTLSGDAAQRRSMR